MDKKITKAFDGTKLLSTEEIEKLDFTELCFYLESLNKISYAYGKTKEVEKKIAIEQKADKENK